MNRTSSLGVKITAHQNPQKVLVNLDSRMVAIDVKIRYEVRNATPAESTSPERGCRSRGLPIRGRQDNLTNDLLHGMGSKGARPHRVRMYAHAAHKALCLQIHFFSLFGKV